MGAKDPDLGLSSDEKERRKQELKKEVEESAEKLVPGWLTETILIKYLRARQWNVVKAATMLKNSVEWRSKAKPECILYVLNYKYL